jgi:nucleoside-diphosphate-sugar epimerase
MQSPSTVLVTGANGFIGKVVISHLLERRWRAKAMMRSPRPFPAEVIIADMRDEASLRIAMKDVSVVIHLAAAKSDEPDSEDVNVDGARRLVAACRAAGCRRVINISTQSAKIQRKGTYGRTKSGADEVLHGSELDVTTLMPSIVYGEEKSGVFGTILGSIQRWPVIPVLGNGQWLSAPIYVGDVAQAIIACIEHDNTIGKRYDLGGPEQIRFDDLLDKLADSIGLKRSKFHIPFEIGLFAVRVLSSLVPKAPITASNVLGSNQNTDIDIGPARRDFGFNPLGLDTGFRLVLSNDRVSHRAVKSAADREELALDSCILARYLLDVEPPRELQYRYAAACLKLLGDQVDAEWRFVQRHTWALPFIDAGAGLLRPSSGVRKRVFLMAAILEATPLYADFFLAPLPRVPQLVFSMALQGFCCMAKAAVGMFLFMLARRG